jgi:hypothetical protein
MLTKGGVKALGKELRLRSQIVDDMQPEMQAALLRLAVTEELHKLRSRSEAKVEMTEHDDGREQAEEARLVG